MIRNVEETPTIENCPLTRESSSDSPDLRWTVQTNASTFAAMSLHQLEGTIKRNLRAFVEVGLALRAIRDRGLHKAKYQRFEDYCRTEWGFGRQNAHRLIEASRIALDLLPIGDIARSAVHESQLRPLLRLASPALQREAFIHAVDASTTKRPTAGQVTVAVNHVLLRERVRAARLADAIPATETQGRARIIHGDAADVSLIASASVHLIIGSPPYNIGAKYPTIDDALAPDAYLAQMRAWLKNCHHWLVNSGGRLCLNVPVDTRKWGPFPFAAEVTKIAVEVGFAYEATIVWDEASHQGHWNQIDPVANPQIYCRCEQILIFSKGGMNRLGGIHMPDITQEEVEEWSCGYWRFAGAHAGDLHPCRYPAELPRRLIRLLSYAADVVLDPWAGSGTTLIEATKLNRQAVGIEIEKEYVTLIRRRLWKV